MIQPGLWREAGKSRKYVAFHVLCKWLALLCSIAVTFLFSVSFFRLFQREFSLTDFWRLGGVLLLLTFFRFLFLRMASRFSFASAKEVKEGLRQKLLGHLFHLGTGYREKSTTAEVVQMAVEGVEQLDTYFGEYLPALFYALLAPLTLFFILSFIHLPAAILLFLLIPLIPLSIAAVQTWAKKLLSRYWSQYTALGDSFLENLYGLTTLKIYDTDSLRQEKMEREAEHFRRVTMRVLTMQLNSITVMDIIAYGGAAAGAILAVKGIQNAALPFDYALFILLVSAEFFIPMRQLGSFFHIAMNGMAAGDKIFRLLGTKADPRGERVLTKNPRICAENLSFSYERDREILSHISLTALPGSRIAIVGESGSGKSTLAALLAGHLRAGEGQVKIDGIAPEEYAPESLNRQITYIGHQGYVFKGTLRENLQMAKPSATEEEMLFFLSLVRIDKLFEKEEGLDTPLLSQAANLSGGQRQRIVLARALLYDSWVYILDEATSNIDVESEEAILEAVRTLHGKKTVIVISHRLANIADADCIYVMEEGKLAESGTHRDLIAKGGYYCSLWNTQKELEAYRGGTL